MTRVCCSLLRFLCSEGLTNSRAGCASGLAGGLGGGIAEILADAVCWGSSCCPPRLLMEPMEKAFVRSVRVLPESPKPALQSHDAPEPTRRPACTPASDSLTSEHRLATCISCVPCLRNTPRAGTWGFGPLQSFRFTLGSDEGMEVRTQGA